MNISSWNILRKRNKENSEDNGPFLNIDTLTCFSRCRFCVGESSLMIKDPVSVKNSEVKTSLINIKENGASATFCQQILIILNIAN